MSPRLNAHTTLLLGEIETGRALALRETATQWCRGDNPPCGHCPICKRVMSGEHPDVHILETDETSIKVADVRDFIGEEGVRPYEAPFKVYLIVRAETMNPAAQNSLLKTLEEPDGDTRFYLIAEKADSLLPTILSRCAIRRIAGEAAQELARRLESGGATAFCAQMAAMLSDGSSARAQKIVHDDGFFETGRRAADAFCRAMTRDGGVPELYAFVSKKQDALCAFVWWRALLHDMMCECGKSGAPRYFSEKPQNFDACAARLGARGAAALLAALDRAQMQIEGNINASLAADGFFAAALKEKKR